MLVISTQNLSKSYGDHDVLHQLNLSIESGRLVGFLGPNGAGKSTTLRILVGLLQPTAGSASILGMSCKSSGREIRRKIGYLAGDVHFYPTLTGRQTLEFVSKVRGQACRQEYERLAEVFELDIDRRVRKYSTGMKQKLGLIQALMHRPQLVILDEPTSALDPLIRTAVFDELRHVVADHRSVLFSSHSLDEVESLCDEVIILRDGKIVEHQTIEKLKQKAVRRVEITFASPSDKPGEIPKMLKGAAWEDNTLKGTWSESAEQLLHWLADSNVADLIISRPDLSDLFLAYYASQSDTPKVSS